MAAAPSPRHLLASLVAAAVSLTACGADGDSSRDSSPLADWLNAINECVKDRGVDSITYKTPDNKEAGARPTDEVWADEALKDKWYEAYGECFKEEGIMPPYDDEEQLQRDAADFKPDFLGGFKEPTR
ncbi:hypothetical protein KG112_05415 [Nocardioides sp. zg-ZUI104]|uniref:hypothetical protein n=1 Tax=Nocardioides faecalis TaxID=2803858 RepID=UPI001BCC9A30|nr:hypothetical protein [Nocardioides faecalis]MBS4752246.1 hypothetical protein [Nocardioides faecalis]